MGKTAENYKIHVFRKAFFGTQFGKKIGWQKKYFNEDEKFKLKLSNIV